MFYVIKNEQMYEYADTISRAMNYPEEAKELPGVTRFEYRMNQDKYKIENGVLVDISNTEEYHARKAAEEKAAKQQELQEQLDALDLKDDEQRLFVARRDIDGHTRATRIKHKAERTQKLSEVWMNGYIGGLPDNF